MTSLTRRSALAALAGSCSLTLEARGVNTTDEPSKGFALIESRLRRHFQTAGARRSAKQLSDELTREGSWPDIDYSDQSVADWKPVEHMRRVRQLCLSLDNDLERRSTGTTDLHDAVARGLAYWLRREPRSGNWWHNTIGMQSELGPVLILCGQRLSPELRERAAALLFDSTQVPAQQATAQNLIWYAKNQLIRGVVRRNPGDVAESSRLISSQLTITTKEGIQADYSFHQHGPQLYSGGYGLTFLVDVVGVAEILDGTEWAVPDSKLDLLAEYALEGLCPLAWRGWLDWGAQGREFTRAVRFSKVAILGKTIRKLEALSRTHRERLRSAALELEGKREPSAGVARYWRSDFLLSRSPSLYFSVKCCSARTIGTESGNGENLQGYWLPFGMTSFLRHGNEFDDLQFVWDWSRLPGVTCTSEVPEFSGYQRHDSEFVGSASVGGVSVASMSLDKRGVRAKKSWFVNGDTVVALGADIASSAGHPIWTTVNQVRLTGDVLVYDDRGNRCERSDLGQVQYATSAWHNGLAYRTFGGPMRVEVQHRGADVIINREMGKADLKLPVLSLLIPHEQGKQRSAYAYAVGVAQSDAQCSERFEHLRVRRNDGAAQVVEFLRPENALLAVLYEPGVVELDSTLSISIRSPCLLAAAWKRGQWTVSVSDPTMKVQQLELLELRTDGAGRVARKVHRLVFTATGQVTLSLLSEWRRRTGEPSRVGTGQPYCDESA